MYIYTWYIVLSGRPLPVHAEGTVKWMHVWFSELSLSRFDPMSTPHVHISTTPAGLIKPRKLMNTHLEVHGRDSQQDGSYWG